MKKMASSFGNTAHRYGLDEDFGHKIVQSGSKGHLDDAGQITLKSVTFGEMGRLGEQAQTTDLAAPTDGATVYSDEAIEDLKFMIEEEKLAGDIYDAFYDAYGLKIFDNIGESEDQHFEAIADYATKIGVDVDSFVFLPAGEYENPELQALYDTLLAQGLESVTAALEVGVVIEEKDLVDIAIAVDSVEDTVLADIYQNLLDGSYSHLAAFDALLG